LGVCREEVAVLDGEDVPVYHESMRGLDRGCEEMTELGLNDGYDRE
jgi:hypothetical protein